MPSHWEAFPSVVPSCLAGFNLVFCGKFYLKTVMKRTINAPKSEIWARMKRMQDANKLWILKEKLQRKNEIKQVWLHHNKPWFSSVQFISVTQLCPTLCDPMNHSTPGLPVQHHLPYICIIILYWCFSFWLTSLCIIDSSFIHLIRTDSNAFFLIAEWYSFVHMYHSFLIHPSANGHLGCFHVIVNSAAMNIGVHVSLSILVSSVFILKKSRSNIINSLVYLTNICHVMVF